MQNDYFLLNSIKMIIPLVFCLEINFYFIFIIKKILLFLISHNFRIIAFVMEKDDKKQPSKKQYIFLIYGSFKK